MAVVSLELPDSLEQLKELYNRLAVHRTYTPAAGTHYAIVGCVLVDAATPASVPALVTAMTGLAQVTSVADPQVWGQVPSELLANHECNLVCATHAMANIGYGGDVRQWSEEQTEIIKPPLNKKWVVLFCVVPSALNQAGIAALEAAISGITGVTTCEHLIDGTIPDNASDVRISCGVQMRIDEIPAE